ncbi:hypothetical protein [Herbaspirillum huttiense]|uniref:hypothetical protein n=1 Tax=Herbaspirillum huttiense TaxID=863372 RepID=UPI0019582700|nr:hypothetical protein [Herbaspirillum huttiense]UWE18935.1 hypothetical protein NY669_12380 [Herbaspirillum huttiense]
MIHQKVSASDPGYLPGLDELGEIHSLPQLPVNRKALPELLPVEQENSLPPLDLPVDPGMVVLNRLLGPECSSDSPAWSINPVPRMRELQKVLIAHSLQLPEQQRGPCLAAVRRINDNIDWRLRLQQMRRSHAEGPSIQQDQENDEKKETA